MYSQMMYKYYVPESNLQRALGVMDENVDSSVFIVLRRENGQDELLKFDSVNYGGYVLFYDGEGMSYKVDIEQLECNIDVEVISVLVLGTFDGNTVNIWSCGADFAKDIDLILDDINKMKEPIVNDDDSASESSDSESSSDDDSESSSDSENDMDEDNKPLFDDMVPDEDTKNELIEYGFSPDRVFAYTSK
jgi:hypothetical protein